MLGSASQDLIQKTSESLAGRVGLIELTPFTMEEVEQNTNFELNKFWLRGGYPDSFLASSDQGSVLWRENFLRTYVERDIPQLFHKITALSATFHPLNIPSRLDKYVCLVLYIIPTRQLQIASFLNV